MQLLSLVLIPEILKLKKKRTMAIFCSLSSTVSSHRIAEAEEFLSGILSIHSGAYYLFMRNLLLTVTAESQYK